MELTSARAIALNALGQWRSSRAFADDMIHRALAKTQLSAPDRSFAQELFYGVLRNLTLLDFSIDALRNRTIESAVRDILRLGFYQLFLLGVPEHAAVSETVALARKSQRSFVNAILRNALRQKQELWERINAQPLSVQSSHPDWLVERWRKHFGDDETADLCRWNNRPPPLYARANRLKTTVAAFLREHSGSSRLAEHDGFFQLSSLPSAALARGDCYMQDPSTGVACRLLDPRPGERILDACAAPGGKTAYLAELMQNCGKIVACDREERRLQRLRENMKRLGARIVDARRHDWLSGGMDAPLCDRILLDAPCTNTGVIRRRVDVRWRLRPDDFERMHEQQVAIGRAVLRLLKPGGVFVYSTCSLEREENEAVVERLAREFPQLKLDKTEAVLPFRDGFDGAFAARFISR